MRWFGAKEIYACDPPPSIFGDGLRYHILEFKNEGALDDYVSWTTRDDPTRYADSMAEGAEQFLDDMDVPEAYRPDYKACVRWYCCDRLDEILLFRNGNTLYVIESFF